MAPVTMPIPKYPAPVPGIIINPSNKAILTGIREIVYGMSLAIQKAVHPADPLLPPAPQTIQAAIRAAKAAAVTVVEVRQ